MTAFILPTLIFPDIANLELETVRIAALEADGIEIRRERLVPEETYFRRVKKKLQECRLTPVIYSIPANLWENGNLNQSLPTYAEEAMWLGADWIKLGLGQQPTKNPADCIAQVKELLKNLPCRLLIENSQQKLTGGTAKSFASFFASLPHEKLAMTFDTGNWQTVGESADEAYALLHSYVAYMHLKGVKLVRGHWESHPIQPDDPWLLRCRHHEMAAIEFPLQTPDIEGKIWLNHLRGES